MPQLTSSSLQWSLVASNELQWPPMASNDLQWPPMTSYDLQGPQWPPTRSQKPWIRKVWQDAPRFGSILVAGGILATLVSSVCCVCCCLQYKRTKKEKEKRRRESEQEEERRESSQVEVWPRFWSFWQKLLTAVDYWNVCQEYTNIFAPSYFRHC